MMVIWMIQFFLKSNKTCKCNTIQARPHFFFIIILCESSYMKQISNDYSNYSYTLSRSYEFRIPAATSVNGPSRTSSI